jgi:NADH:ubiquinone oxidoreductase subunit H
VRPVEGAIALLFTLGGLRSLWYWLRRPFEGTDVADQVLYALFVTARIGLWFAFAGLFWIYATLDVQGRAALDELRQYAWYLMVPIALAAVQLGAGWFLGRRGAGTKGASPRP